MKRKRQKIPVDQPLNINFDDLAIHLFSIQISRLIISDKSLLLRHLKLYSFCVPKAQNMLLNNIELRRRHPWFFNERDPLAPEMQKIIETL